MSYLGSTPTTQSFIAGTDYFNGTGSAINFTLSRAVNSVNDIEVIVNNVEQIPSGYTVSGTTLTFSVAPSAGTSNVYVRYLSTTLQSITVPAGTTVGGNFGVAGNLTVTANTASDALRITQTGTGNAFVVEDSTSPDSSPFVITSAGNVGIGTSSPTRLLDVTTTGATNSIIISQNTTASNGGAQIRAGNPQNTIIMGTDTNAGGLTGTANASFLSTTSTTPIVFLPNEIERMRITSAGNVGIGTSSPVTRLDISQANAKSATTAWQMQVFDSTSQATGVGGGISFGGYKTAQSAAEYFAAIDGYKENSTAGNAAGALRFHTQVSGGSGLVERMRIDSAGNVGIGTSSPATKLHVAAAANSGVLISSANGTTFKGIAFNTSDAQFTVGTQTNHPLAFFTNNAERARIDSSGNLLVGTTSPVASGSVSFVRATAGTVLGIRNTNANGAALISFVNVAGSEVGFITSNGTTTTYSTSSDYRLKDTIAPMTGALARVALLRPCTYKWKVDGSDGQGFIAHELAEVEPGCVTGEKDAVDKDGKPQYQGIDTSFLVATLTAAIQELKAIVDAQGAEIAALKGTP